MSIVFRLRISLLRGDEVTYGTSTVAASWMAWLGRRCIRIGRAHSIKPVNHLGVCRNHALEFGNSVDDLVHEVDLVADDNCDDVRIPK